MGKPLAITFEPNKFHTYDGVNFKTHTIDKSLLSINSHYAQAHAWVTTLVATLMSGVTTVIMDAEEYNPTATLVAPANFDEFYEISGLYLMGMVAGAINDYVKTNKATVKGFKLPYMTMRHYCLKCDALNPPPTLRHAGDNSPVARMDTCKHESPNKRQLLYSLVKHLTTPLGD